MIFAQQRLDHHYGRALQLLRENPAQSQIFPVTRFLWYAAFALISDAQGQRDDATEAAAKALSCADVTDSGFQYHPGVGLVGSRYDELKRKLRRFISN